MRIGYADPPYPGCAHLYKDHPDYAGEVDHAALINQLEGLYDGWVLHTSVGGLRMMESERLLPETGIRICQWFKPFAAFKRNVSVAYAYEPVIVKAVRKPVVSHRVVMRDWIEEAVKESITMKKGLAGVKPKKVLLWAFEMVGAEPTDDLVDIFPGSGAVMEAWREWQSHIAESLSLLEKQ